jgi:penicillin V acylase-like amidase (Ntn superfamily)
MKPATRIASDRQPRKGARHAGAREAWTSVADLKNLRWYFRNFTDQSIHMVDLKQAVEAAKGEVRSIKMEGTTQPITDASANFVAGK